jgi:signal transduction histidine kinase
MGTDARLDSWERRVERLINLVPYVALVVSAALTWGLSSVVPQAPLPVTLTLSAFAGAWMLWFVTLHPAWQTRRVLMGFYFFVLIALIAALVIRAPVYGFFAFSGYLHGVYALHGRLRALGVGLTAVLCALSQVGGVGTLASPAGVMFFLVVMAFNLGVAGIMFFFSWITVEQAARRQRMIAELAEANAKLEAAMAENAGLHAQLLAQAREAGVLDERARMAREIHDTIAQGLTGIITQLEAARQVAVERLPHGSETSYESEQRQRHLDAAAGLARQSLSEARRSVRNLQPEPLDGVPLPDALADVAHHWSDLHALTATVTTTGTPRPMHPEIEGTLLRTAQEALANVAKHANATRVGLTLSYMEDQVTLDVRDDGAGFDPSAAPPADGPGGFGLRAMRQRLDRVAGWLEIESEPGAGAAICATVPAIPSQVGPAPGSGQVGPVARSGQGGAG